MPIIKPISVTVTPLVQNKLFTIVDQNESNKEATLVTRALHEFYKILKRRAADVAIIKGLISECGGNISRGQEETLNKIVVRETARVQNEGKKLAVLELFLVEDKELKK